MLIKIFLIILSINIGICETTNYDLLTYQKILEGYQAFKNQNR